MATNQLGLLPLQHYSGLEEAVFRNIGACKELTQSTRTSLGPNGMNKMIINHIDKLFVTNDAATVLRELEVQVSPSAAIEESSCARLIWQTRLHGQPCKCY